MAPWINPIESKQIAKKERVWKHATTEIHSHCFPLTSFLFNVEKIIFRFGLDQRWLKMTCTPSEAERWGDQRHWSGDCSAGSPWGQQGAVSEKRKGKRVVNSPRDYSPFPCGSGSRTARLMGRALYPLVSLSGSSGQTVYTKKENFF